MGGQSEKETSKTPEVSEAKIVSPSCDPGSMWPPEKPDEAPHEKEKISGSVEAQEKENGKKVYTSYSGKVEVPLDRIKGERLDVLRKNSDLLFEAAREYYFVVNEDSPNAFFKKMPMLSYVIQFDLDNNMAVMIANAPRWTILEHIEETAVTEVLAIVHADVINEALKGDPNAMAVPWENFPPVV